MIFKPILKAVIATLAPFLFDILTKLSPAIPLTLQQLTELILWLAALAIGGWQANTLATRLILNAKALNRYSLKTRTQASLINTGYMLLYLAVAAMTAALGLSALHIHP